MPTIAQIVEVLNRPTPPHEVSFIPRGVKEKQNSNNEGYATAIPYIDSSFVENTLDEACGKLGWQTDIKQVAGVMCQGIGIKADDLEWWIWRWDVGLEKEQDEHGSKAEVTAGLKRAARQFGIGRDLKDYPKPRLLCEIWMGADHKGKPKVNFIKWVGDIRDQVMRAGQNGGGSESEDGEKKPAGNGKPDATSTSAKATGATEGHQADDVNPAQARRMCYDFAIERIEMSNKEANAWINDQEKEHGRTLESYRTIYGLLQAKHKANQPPPH